MKSSPIIFYSIYVHVNYVQLKQSSQLTERTVKPKQESVHFRHLNFFKSHLPVT